jgi:fructose-bisphosphate aldolase, class I
MTIQEIANQLVAKGKGILAADESTGTIGKRFDAIGVENSEENRQMYRELLFTTEGVEQYVSGVILFDETIRQSTKDGILFSKLLADKGILSGIKVDMKTHDLPGAPLETMTEGLDGLRGRLKEYVSLGATFAKWRAVYTITDELPSEYCISVNAHALARYAALCQEAGIVPIVEPEVLMDGDHTIERCFEVTKKVLEEVFVQLKKQRVALDGMILKPNMVIPGGGAQKPTPEQVAERTIACFKDVVPADVPGITFLSGGQTEQEACENLNAMNLLGDHPWELSFSYGRALQAATLKAWDGKEENKASAQVTFLKRAKLTSKARLGTYSSELE